MRQTARIVVDADPEIKKMLEELKVATGATVKDIVERLVREEHARVLQRT